MSVNLYYVNLVTQSSSKVSDRRWFWVSGFRKI